VISEVTKKGSSIGCPNLYKSFKVYCSCGLLLGVVYCGL